MHNASTTPSRTVLAVCRAGIRRNRIPALMVQAFAGTLVALYCLAPELRPWFELIGAIKARYNPGFAIISTAFFGGLIPWLVLMHRGRIPSGQHLRHLSFYVGFWALQGAVVNTLYSGLNAWLGPNKDLQTLLLKVLIDQGPFNLLWGTPCCLFLMGWKDAEFSWSRFRVANPPRVLAHRFLTIQVSAWVVWIPAVTMIYSLPADLQIPLFNLVVCFFSLLLTFVSRG